MESFEGAELCELIGIYIQSILAKITSKRDMSLYRGNGLLGLKNKNGQETDKIRKRIVKSLKIPILVMTPSLTWFGSVFWMLHLT